MKRIDTDTALALIGLGILALGIGLVFVPAALIVVGGLLLIYAVAPDRRPSS